MTVTSMSLTDFQQKLREQGVSSREHRAFKCPMCGTVQSMHSFKVAGVDAEQAEQQVGFSCVGRHTNAPGPRKEPDGNPCNWTLGGLFKFHELEVIDDQGKAHPFFAIASPAEAQALHSSSEAVT